MIFAYFLYGIRTSGDRHSWNKLVLKCLSDREGDRCSVKVKPNYVILQLKSCLSREEYLHTCKNQARLICMFRGGTNEHRVEMRWKEEKLERTCLVCAYYTILY